MAIPAPADHPLASEIARPYRFVRTLATGGMGEVAVVEHVALGEQRVMKLMRQELVLNETLGHRMEVEGRVLTKLKHPNLVQVLDLGGTVSGRPFLVTELLEGETLKDWQAAHGVMAEDEVLEVARQTLLGLEQAHAAGVIHRDIKPDNLFYALGPAGRTVKILDFGVAKLTAAADRKALGHKKSTVDGLMLGTPQFVAPEQAMGKKVDVRVDVYALGCTLFRLATGRPVFVEDGAVEILKAHVLKDRPVPSSIALQPLSAGFDALVLRAIAKKPADRYESAAAMRKAVEALLRRGTAADPAPVVTIVAPASVAPEPARAPVAPLVPLAPGADQDSAHGTMHFKHELEEVVKAAATPARVERPRPQRVRLEKLLDSEPADTPPVTRKRELRSRRPTRAALAWPALALLFGVVAALVAYLVGPWP